jgi:hypothetical protein
VSFTRPAICNRAVQDIGNVNLERGGTLIFKFGYAQKPSFPFGKPRHRQSHPMKLLATPRGAHDDHAEDDERNAKASLSNADSIDLHRLTWPD